MTHKTMLKKDQNLM